MCWPKNNEAQYKIVKQVTQYSISLENILKIIQILNSIIQLETVSNKKSEITQH